MEGRHDEAWVDETSHTVWAALRQAQPALTERLAPHGIVGVHFVVGFVHPFKIHVWLATATDDERDALPAPDPYLAEVRQVIAAAGFPSEHGMVAGTVAESQETVDRDYEGSWWYAQR